MFTQNFHLAKTYNTFTKNFSKSLNYWRPVFFSGSLIRELAPSSSLIKESTERIPPRPDSPPELPEPILKIDDA